MARLWTSGFELQSATAGIEFAKAGLNGGGISTSTFRSGAASMQINVSASFSWFGQVIKSSSSSTEAFCRVYVNFTTFPGATTEVVSAFDSVAVAVRAAICVTSAGVVQLLTNGPGGTQIGSNGPTLLTGQWYCLEMDVSGGSGTATLNGRVDGVQFAGSATATVNNFDSFYLGNPLTSATMNLFYDDWAINDTSGASQTSYPGPGKVISLLPNAAGDVNTFATQTGGTAGSSNNFTRVDEVTPDDATSFNGSSTLNQEDLFKCGASGLSPLDTVKVVQIGFRFRNSTADATAAIKAEVEKTGSGTITQSSAIIPNSTTWKTNGTTTAFGYAITLYNDPDGNPWVQSTLNTMQIGYKLTTGPGTSGRRIDVTKVWATIDYDPAILSKVLVAGQAVNRAGTY
jgi:hypothetical protein